MRAVVQRVSRGSVTADGLDERIGRGLVVLVGVEEDDTKEDAQYIASKAAHLRVFEDEQGKMNLSLLDVGGEALVISQFTLYGDCRRGRRPSFTRACSSGETAKRLYELVVEELKKLGITTRTGRFGAYMTVGIENDGPVTLLLDSKKSF